MEFKFNFEIVEFKLNFEIVEFKLKKKKIACILHEVSTENINDLLVTCFGG